MMDKILMGLWLFFGAATIAAISFKADKKNIIIYGTFTSIILIIRISITIIRILH
jgi:hypothetical protein